MVSRLTIAGEEPPHVRPPEGAGQRRMKILLGVGVKVMSAVVRRPPERPFLVSRRRREGEQKLENPASLVRAVREEAMKPGGYREHSHDVQSQAGDDCHQADARPDGEQASHMHGGELSANEVI